MFGSKRVRGRAVIAGVDEMVGNPDEGDSFLLEDVAEAMWGRSSHHLVIDVHLPGHGSYRVQGAWKVPNRLGSLRRTIARNRRLQVGMVLPVLVDPNRAGDVEIDWKAFVASGELERHDEQGLVATITGGIREMVADMRRAGEPDPVAPTVPRPTDATHPPIAGIGFDQWIGAVVAGLVARVRRRQREAHYLAHGLPPGRVDEVNTGWVDRVKRDPVVSAWYIYEMRRVSR